jgi:hypothetical protein
MSVDVKRLSDDKILGYGVNFATVSGANMAILKIDQLVVDDMTAKTNDFETKLNGVALAEANLRNAVKAKSISREIWEKCIKGHTKAFQILPDMDDALRAALNITIRDSIPSPLVPYEPKELDATPLPSGTVKLNWKSGDNKPTMTYVIEMRKEGQPDFTVVDRVTATKYDHKGQKPGEFKIYRIKARKGDSYSEPSNEASVYSDEMKI